MTKETKIKVIAIAIILVSIMAIVSIVCVNAINAYKLSKPYDGLVVGGSGDNGAISEGTYPLPSNLMFTSTSAESATAAEGVTLTATVKPNTVLNKKVFWRLEWADSSDEWIGGRSSREFAEINPISEGGTTAVLTCIKPFGAQLKIRVISQENPDASAECIVDYAKRAINAGVTLAGREVANGGSVKFKADTSASFNAQVNYDLGVGTVDDTFTCSNVKLELNRSLFPTYVSYSDTGANVENSKKYHPGCDCYLRIYSSKEMVEFRKHLTLDNEPLTNFFFDLFIKFTELMSLMDESYAEDRKDFFFGAESSCFTDLYNEVSIYQITYLFQHQAYPDDLTDADIDAIDVLVEYFMKLSLLYSDNEYNCNYNGVYRATFELEGKYSTSDLTVSIGIDTSVENVEISKGEIII